MRGGSKHAPGKSRLGNLTSWEVKVLEDGGAWATVSRGVLVRSGD